MMVMMLTIVTLMMVRGGRVVVVGDGGSGVNIESLFTREQLVMETQEFEAPVILVGIDRGSQRVITPSQVNHRSFDGNGDVDAN